MLKAELAEIIQNAKTPAPDDEQAWTKLLLNTEIL
jgi:hypothetical protein